MIASGDYSYQLISEFQNTGVNIKRLPSRKNSVDHYITALVKLMKEEKYDAVYRHESSAILSIELIIARMCGCEIRVVHSHNTICDHKMADKWYCLLARLAKKYYCFSKKVSLVECNYYERAYSSIAYITKDGGRRNTSSPDESLSKN